nr:augmin subunit 6 [Tanacetum cinerariifolium]
MWSNLAHQMTAEYHGFCAEEAYLQQELEKLHDLRNKVKIEGQHEVLASGTIEDLIAHREHRYHISGSSLLAAIYRSQAIVNRENVNESLSTSQNDEKSSWMDDRSGRGQPTVDIADVLRRWTHALQRIHKQLLHLAKANDGEGPDLIRSANDGGVFHAGTNLLLRHVMLATFKTVGNVTSELTTLSNMPVFKETIDGDFKTVSFEEATLMSTYLVAVMVGIKVRAYCPVGKTEKGKLGLSISAKSIIMVAVPDFSGGTMENYGLITYREAELLHDDLRSAAENTQRLSLAVTHEVRQQWFGTWLVKDYVIECIGSEIKRSHKSECIGSELDEEKNVKEPKGRPDREWRKEEYCDKLAGDGSKNEPTKDSGTSMTFQCPVLNSTNYTIWAVKIKALFNVHGIWEAVEPTTNTEVDQKKNNMAIAMLYQAILENMVLQIASLTSAKEIWEALKVRHLGIERVKEARVQTIVSEFESLKMGANEPLDNETTKDSGTSMTFQCSVLNSTNYTIWAVKIKALFNVHGILEAVEPTTNTEVDQKKNNMAIAMLYQAILENMAGDGSKNEPTKDSGTSMTFQCPVRHLGIERVKEARVQTIESEFESLKMGANEPLDVWPIYAEQQLIAFQMLGQLGLAVKI